MGKALLFYLVITIVTPNGSPNKEAVQQMPDLSSCVAAGMDFVSQKASDLGGEALAFSCVVGPKPGDPA